jgi:hypothetical protein
MLIDDDMSRNSIYDQQRRGQKCSTGGGTKRLEKHTDESQVHICMPPQGIASHEHGLLKSLDESAGIFESRRDQW